MSDKVIIVVGDSHNSSSYFSPFASFGTQEDCQVLFTKPERVQLVVFTGGEDVDPTIYGERRNKKTYSNINRDREEEMYFNVAARLKIPMAGICRGAQFICAMSGGKLAQHIWNHHQNHSIRTLQGTVTVTSTHHQMQLPPKDAKILAWAEPRLSKHYEGPDGVELFPEVEYEGVYYPSTKALGMQWHPEWMHPDSDGWKFTESIIQKLLSAKLG